MDRVAGKVALITGAASGLGKADAILLAREGAKVVVADINDEAGRAVAKEVDGEFVHLDVRSEDDWRRAIARTIERFSKLNVLINNAGNAIAEKLDITTLEQYRLIQAIHSEGTFLGCKHGVEAMKEHGGSIINMSSLAALRTYPLFLAYSAAKGAIRSLSRTVAAHCQDEGYAIRCNAVFPGIIDTPMVQAVVGHNYPGAGRPEDIANIVLYLSSDESRYVTGAEFVIDNGATLRAGSSTSA